MEAMKTSQKTNYFLEKLLVFEAKIHENALDEMNQYSY